MDKIIGLDRVRSGGFVNPGQRASKKIREYAKRAGYDLSIHRSALVTKEDVDWADIVVYMDSGNFKRLVEKFPDADDKFVCLGSFINEPRIADPNYIPRGPELEKILEKLVTASRSLGKGILKGMS